MHMTKGKSKVRLNTTLDRELMEWVDSQIETSVFATKAHAIERGLKLLKAELGGDL